MKPRHCQMCDAELVDDRTGAATLCPKCQAELDTPITLGPEPPRLRLDIPAPRVGLHVAAAPVDDVQRCARCGDVLKIYAPGQQPATLPTGHFYPEGSRVERFAPGWQAVYLGQREPDCETEPRA